MNAGGWVLFVLLLLWLVLPIRASDLADRMAVALVAFLCFLLSEFVLSSVAFCWLSGLVAFALGLVRASCLLAGI